MKRTLLCTALFALVLGGCAARQATRESAPQPAAAPASDVPQRDFNSSPAVSTGAPSAEHSDYQQLMVHDRELDTLLLGVPDCHKACEHLTAMCQLAERICGLAQEEPDETLQGQCRDGKDRCERARTRTAASCECTP